jgi:hypothetical protein
MSLFLNSLAKPNPADFSFEYEGLVGTVELKVSSPHRFASVFVTQLTQQKIGPVFEARLPIPPTRSPKDSSTLESNLIQLLQVAKASDGFLSPFETGTLEQRGEVALVHMLLHDQLGNLESLDNNLNLRTARQYEIAKAFGIGTAVALIARFESVSSTVVTRRLTRARDAGLIEKQLNKLPRRNKVSDGGNMLSTGRQRGGSL